MASRPTGDAGTGTGTGVRVDEDEHDEKLYAIEASVVTGFEETARGEAKELFNTEVKAARGKITWTIPYNRIQDVLKMGSIDNFKVVMHSVPHFHFTDQHDSLACLQKMVADVDWESGLRVWRLFNNFSHPIPSQPEVIPSPDELVEVVIMGNLPAKKGKEEKKYKKGGNWKKKKDKKQAKEIQREGNIRRKEAENIDKTNSKESDTALASATVDFNSSVESNKLNIQDESLNETDLSNVEVKPIGETELNNVEVKPLCETELQNVEVKPLCETELQNVEVKRLLEKEDENLETKPFVETDSHSAEVKTFDELELQNDEIEPLDQTASKNVVIRPLGETELQNNKVEPLDKTEIQNVEVKLLFETELQNVEIKPVCVTEVQNIDVKPLGETELQNNEVKSLGETELQNVDVKLLGETELQNVDVKLLGETELQYVDVKLLGETELQNVDVKLLGETELQNVDVKLLGETELQNVDVKLFGETELQNVDVKLLGETELQNVDVKLLGETELQNVEDKLLETKVGNNQPDLRSNNIANIDDAELKISGKLTKTILQEPKTVIIKRREDWDKDTKIDIKVLLPNPDENMFPAKLTDSDDRNVEPMDVDMSMSNASISDDTLGNLKDMSVSKLKGNNETSVNTAPSDECLSSLSETEFASSVIKKLTSPPIAQMRTFEGGNSPRSTGTPPPTPTLFVTSLADLPSSKDASVSESLPNGNHPAADQTTELRSETGLASSHDDSCLSKSSPEAIVAGSSVTARDPTIPTFRVTCNRNGDSHPFDSPSAAASFGSAVNRYHHWIVDLSNYDIEVILDIDNDEVNVCLGLTRTSLHKRNMVVFGPTTLRATICYNMLRLCRIKTGDVICDPMCGSGALPIEGAMSWVNCFHLGGDNHGRAIDRTLQNVSAIQEKIKIEQNRKGLKLDVVQWSIEHFPLRDQCVDVFISDLPFGHRLGNRASNRTLYPNLLTEMARTATTGARACLLTEDKANFIKAISNLSKFWQRRLVLNINIGGLSGFVFVLTRTATAIRSQLATWDEAANISQDTALGSGDAGKLPPVDSTDIPKLDSPKVLSEVTNIKKTDSSHESDMPVSCEGNIFC